MAPLDTTKDLWALFSDQVRRTPDAPALEDESAAYTYAELERAARRLAARLRDRHGVVPGKDQLVGVLLGRSADYVIACLAALCASAAFLVLELAYPPALMAKVIEDARPVAIVTHAAHAGRIVGKEQGAAAGEVPVIRMDEVRGSDDHHHDWKSAAAADSTGEEGRIAADAERNGHAAKDTRSDPLSHLAFVSYSSGTTGLPKGIANPHRAPVLSYALRFSRLGSDLAPGDRVACNVFFVWEMLRPLLRGATVFAVPDEASYDPAALVPLLAARRVTETLMTPTLLATVLSRYPRLGRHLPLLRTLWLNGEVVTADLARRAVTALRKTENEGKEEEQGSSSCRLLNCYSASETHEIAVGSIGEMVPLLGDDAAVCPVGELLDPERMYILDPEGKPVAPGCKGELFVGGDLLARGYLNLPETTAKAFVPDPFAAASGARMYRTGDVVRLLQPSGLLEISGRVGAMIKVRGYSVQPGLVESAVVRHLAVQQCAVAAHGDGVERQLVAYFVRDNDVEAAGEGGGGGRAEQRATPVVDESGRSPAARKALAEHLPPYMIPAVWVEMEKLPTHAVSGKADTASLPPPPKARAMIALASGAAAAGKGASATSAPGSAVTNGGSKPAAGVDIHLDAIADQWAASLNIPRGAVAPDHDFFDLGGHSLALADLSRRFSQTFGIPIPIAPLAGSPTLIGHLNMVRSARDGHVAAVQADLPAALQVDSVLPADIRPAAGAAAPAMCPLDEADTVLLTGATGFLGAFLLHELLEKTSAQVVCLVRFPDPAAALPSTGMARVRKNLVDLGLWRDAMLDRISVLPANLARTRLGLTRGAFDELAARVQVIIHAAATVNLIYPYAALRAANVGGTREILRLASRGGATVHHVSSNGVLPPCDGGWREDEAIDLQDVPTRLHKGYDQTKWVAERLVSEAARRGIPTRIYRPGTISGHSVTGATNAWDLLWAVIVEALNLGRAPQIPGEEWKAEMAPVDFVSSAIIALCNYVPTSASESTTRGPAAGTPRQIVFHLGDPAPLPARQIFEYFSQLGYPTTPMPWTEWLELWTSVRGDVSSRGGDDAFPAAILKGGMPSAEALRAVTVLRDDGGSRAALEALGIERPATDLALLATYARHFCARGWLQKGPSGTGMTNGTASKESNDNNKKNRPRGPLADKVAIVTGASSGIGAAVAVALARAGARVALAARRVDMLEGVRKHCIAAGRAGGLHDIGGGGGSRGEKPTVSVHPTDVTDRKQVDGLVLAATEALDGPPDIIVCCAGVMYYTLMANAKTDQWERIVDVNCKGLLNCLAATVPGMLWRLERQRQAGGATKLNDETTHDVTAAAAAAAAAAPASLRTSATPQRAEASAHVVAISSDAGRKVFKGLGVYSASKMFVEGALQALRLETAGTGLRVTSVQPGNVDTGLVDMSTDREAVDAYGSPSGARVLDADDVARAVVYALSQPPHVAVNEVLVEPRDEPI